MAEPLALIAVIIASAGVLFYAFDRRLIRRLAREVHTFLGTASAHLHDPAYLGEVLGHTLTHGIKRDDGGPVSTGMVIDLLIEKRWPDIKEQLPQLVAAYASGGPPSSGGGRAPDGTFTKGGWSAAAGAAQAAAKATKSSKVQQLAEYMQLFQQVKPMIDQLNKGAGGGGSGNSPQGSNQQQVGWRPPV